MSATRNPKRHHYSAYGLTVHSDIPLPELAPLGRAPGADVRVRLGRVRTPTFLWKGESRIRVRGAREITVEILPGADRKAVRLSILGPAFSKLLERRGLLVLHASAVRMDREAVAFLGAAGAGKSTLAAALHRRGHALVTDNQLVLRFTGDKVFAIPTFPQFKLWPDSARSLGLNIDRLPWIDAVTRKRSLLFQKRFAEGPVRVRRIYLLSKGRSVCVTRPAPGRKLFQLLRHSLGRPDFLSCARLAGAVPIRFLRRTARLSSLEDLVRVIEEDLRPDPGLN